MPTPRQALGQWVGQVQMAEGEKREREKRGERENQSEHAAGEGVASEGAASGRERVCKSEHARLPLTLTLRLALIFLEP